MLDASLGDFLNLDFVAQECDEGLAKLCKMWDHVPVFNICCLDSSVTHVSIVSVCRSSYL